MTRISLPTFAREINADSFEEALTTAIGQGYRIDKYADPIDGAAEGLTVEAASAIADEDPTLITLCR
jgi:hypothetical protein